MEVEIRALSFDNAEQITEDAALSTFWALPWDPLYGPTHTEDPAFDKQLWIQRTLMSWGTCGFTAFVGTGVPGRKLQPAATVFFAPARFLPGVEGLPSSVSSDALLLSDVYVEDAFMGLYLEHRLIETVLVEAGRRGFSAVEVFARDEDALDELLRKQEQESRGVAQDAGLEYSGTPSFPSPSSAASSRSSLDPSLRIENAPSYVPEAYRGWQTPEALHTGNLLKDALSVAPMLSMDVVEEAEFERVDDHELYPRYRREVSGAYNLFLDHEGEAF